MTIITIIIIIICRTTIRTPIDVNRMTHSHGFAVIGNKDGQKFCHFSTIKKNTDNDQIGQYFIAGCFS